MPPLLETLNHWMTEARILGVQGTVHQILIDPRTFWFCVGVSFEGLGLFVQNMMGMPTYPIIDGVVIGLIAALCWYYSRGY